MVPTEMKDAKKLAYLLPVSLHTLSLLEGVQNGLRHDLVHQADWKQREEDAEGIHIGQLGMLFYQLFY